MSTLSFAIALFCAQVTQEPVSGATQPVKEVKTRAEHTAEPKGEASKKQPALEQQAGKEKSPKEDLPKTQPSDTAKAQPSDTEEQATKEEQIPKKKVALHEHPTLVRMLEENNRLRKSVGLPPQRMSPELTNAAQNHARYMARTGRLSHHSNGGPAGRSKKFGYKGLAAENIAMGYRNVKAVFQGWRTSRGHWSNIKGGAEVAGFGYAISSGGSGYWVAMYGY